MSFKSACRTCLCLSHSFCIIFPPWPVKCGVISFWRLIFILLTGIRWSCGRRNLQNIRYQHYQLFESSLYLLKLLFRVTILLMHTLLKLCYTCGLQLFSSFTICYKVTVRLPEISFPFVLLGLIISSSPTKLGRTAGGADKNYNASNSYTEPILKTCALTSQRGL